MISRRSIKKFRPTTTPQDKRKIYYFDETGQKNVKSIPQSTEISELPSICLNAPNDSKYLIYIDDKLITNTSNTLEGYSDKIVVKFSLQLKCVFTTVQNPEGVTVDFSRGEPSSFVNIFQNQSQDFYIFNSSGNIENIDHENYQSALSNNTNYFLIDFPAALQEKQNSLNLNSPSIEKKQFLELIMNQLKIHRPEFQRLLCILYSIVQNQKLKNNFINLVQKYAFKPLVYLTREVFLDKSENILLNKLFLPFLFSLSIIKSRFKSYLEAFEDLFKSVDLPNPPFLVADLRKLFYFQNLPKNTIVLFDADSYALFQGESLNEPDLIKLFDPLENNDFDLNFADHFLNTFKNEGKTINFEDIFFDTREFELTDQSLGDGSYGHVIIAVDSSGSKYAAKVINTQNEFNGIDQMRLMRESMILQKLHHPSIVNFKGINFQSFDDQKKLQPTIITDFIPNGSLVNFLKSGFSHNWNPTKKYIALLGISNAMRYLHQYGIIHRDIKPANILIDANYYPLICDFGISRCFPDALTKSMELTRSCNAGTPAYLAPELIEEDHYGPGVDVYAFAILAYEIISEKNAYFEIRETNNSYFRLLSEVKKGTRPQFNDLFSEKMKDLLTQCWDAHPAKRPTFEFIFNALSNDFNFSKEKIDISEVKNYIEKVGKVPEPPTHVILGKIPVQIKEVENIFFNTNDYVITNKELGHGSFSTVYLAKKISDNKNYSVRIIKEEDLFKGYEQMILLRESILLNRMNHPFIIKFFGLNFQSFNNPFTLKPRIIIEYLENGSLARFLTKKLDYTKKCIFLLGIAHAMKYMHEQGILHGFLSADNILVDENFYPRIRFPHSFSDNTKHDFIVRFATQRYIAPELFRGEEFYGPEIDVYSFGIIAYEILSGHEAYIEQGKKISQNEFRKKIISGSRPKFGDGISDDIKSLIKCCWSDDYMERPSFDTIYSTLIKYLHNIPRDAMDKFNQIIKDY